MCETAGLIVFPNQLIQAVILVGGGGVGSVRDRQNVAVIVVGIAVSDGLAAYSSAVCGDPVGSVAVVWDWGAEKRPPFSCLPVRQRAEPSTLFSISLFFVLDIAYGILHIK